jgi:hypothetical protein
MFTILIQIILLFGIATLPGLCFGAKPVSAFNRNLSKGQSTVEGAAAGALRLSRSKSASIEYGGCLFRSTDSGEPAFFFTEPATNGSTDDFSISCDLPAGAKLVGLYHTHPRGSETGISSNDIEVAKKLNVVSFVAFIDEQKIMSFTPGKTRTRCFRSGPGACPSGQRIADGDFVQKLDSK